jgi:Protein of unknown function (DUF2478)
MWRFTRRWTDRTARIAGVIEVFDPTIGRSRHATHLKNVRTGEVYPLFQELGPMASACHLDGAVRESGHPEPRHVRPSLDARFPRT